MLAHRLPHWVAVVVISVLALACSRETPEKPVVEDARAEAREQAQGEAVAMESSGETDTQIAADIPPPASTEPETASEPEQAPGETVAGEEIPSDTPQVATAAEPATLPPRTALPRGAAYRRADD